MMGGTMPGMRLRDLRTVRLYLSRRRTLTEARWGWCVPSVRLYSEFPALRLKVAIDSLAVESGCIHPIEFIFPSRKVMRSRVTVPDFLDLMEPVAERQ